MATFTVILLITASVCNLATIGVQAIEPFDAEFDKNVTQNFEVALNMDNAQFAAKTKLINPLIDIKALSVKILELLKLFQKSIKAFGKTAKKLAEKTKMKTKQFFIAAAKKAKLLKVGAKDAIVKDLVKNSGVAKTGGFMKAAGKSVEIGNKDAKVEAIGMGVEGAKQIASGLEIMKDAAMELKAAKKVIEDKNLSFFKSLSIPKMTSIERLPGLSSLLGVLKQWASACTPCSAASPPTPAPAQS